MLAVHRVRVQQSSMGNDINGLLYTSGWKKQRVHGRGERGGAGAGVREGMGLGEQK